MDKCDRQDPHRQVDQENPSPGYVFRQRTAERRSGDGGDSPDARQPSLHRGPFAYGIKVAGQRRDGGHGAAGTETLYGAEHDQRRHIPGKRRGCGTDEEDHGASDQDGLTPKQIREFAIDGNRYRLRQQVDGKHPAKQAEATEVRHDLGNRGRHDGRIHRGEHHRRHQRGEHQPAPSFLTVVLHLFWEAGTASR